MIHVESRDLVYKYWDF